MKNKGISLLPHPACLPHLHGAVLVGLSGGRDSVALLHVLLQQGCCVHACHVHHGIRGAADADAEFCRTLCERLGVPFEQHRIDVPALAETRRVSLETAARSALPDGIRHFGAYFGMALKVTATGFIHSKAGGLARIVQQRGPAKTGLFGNGRHHMGGVGIHIVDMVGRMLGKAHRGGELRDHPAQDRREAQKILRGDQGEKFT